ncbi:MAG: hypothetical protein H7A33_03075 [Deltaproteobacteria bacterium]|nr:hypothetical protein [Deltaproteobacteria bacterium]
MKRVLIILCLLSFACSPSGTSILSGGSSSSTSGTTDSADIGGPSIGAGSPVNSAEDDLGTDSSSDIPGESNVDGTDLPHGGIAIPRLESSSLVAYAPDSSDYVPVVGSEGTVEDFESGSMLVVSEESLGAELASVEFMSLRATKERGNPGWIQMATTLAPSPWSLAPRSAHAASDICSEGSNHCCEINSDGSFECYYPLESKSVSNLNLAILLPSGEIGESITEPLQSNLRFKKRTH